MTPTEHYAMRTLPFAYRGEIPAEVQDEIRESMTQQAKAAKSVQKTFMSEKSRRGHAEAGRTIAATAAEKRAKDVPQVMSLHRQGVSMPRIATAIGRSRHYVWRILSEQGVA